MSFDQDSSSEGYIPPTNNTDPCFSSGSTPDHELCSAVDPPIQPDEVFLEDVDLAARNGEVVDPELDRILQEIGAALFRLEDFFSQSPKEQRLRRAAMPSVFTTGYSGLSLLIGAYIASTPTAAGDVEVNGIFAGSLLSGLSIYQLARSRLTAPRLDETLPVHASDAWRRSYLNGNEIPPPTHYVKDGITYNLANQQIYPKPDSN